MEELNGTSENYIIYLQLSAELTDDFFQLAHFFNEWGISLLPVLPNALGELTRGKRQHILCYVPDHASHKRYRFIFEKVVKMGLLSKKYFLHEITSFGKVENSHQFLRMGCYLHHRLPMSVETFVKMTTRSYLLDKMGHRKWPGARRSRLPSLISGV